MSRFEWLVALRYLRAKRKQTVISVITVISVLGVAAGVAALILALAINNGFQNALQSSLLSATAHVNVLERNPAYGIEDWQQVITKISKVPQVVSASPGLYGQVAIKGPLVGSGAVLKGVPIGGKYPVPELLRRMKDGSLTGLSRGAHGSGIILGAGLAKDLGVHTGNTVSVFSYQGRLTPMGVVPSLFKFRVAGTFESGLYELDSSWAFVSLAAAQRVLDLSDVVNTIELRLGNIFKAPEVARAVEKITGPALIASTWMDQNRSLLKALTLEKTVSIITVSLIEIVASLNILVVLVMLVMEKQRDIAILRSMGCRPGQIQRIFVLQGLIIGILGCVIGLTVGYTVAALGQHYHPFRLDDQIYAISYVPFEVHWTDGIWVSALALFTSFIATLQPSWTAARIAPAEALRYE